MNALVPPQTRRRLRTWFWQPERTDMPLPLPIILLNSLIAIAALSLVFIFSFAALRYHWDWPAVYKYREKLLWGWLRTIGVSAAAIPLTMLIGAALALARRNRFLPLRYASRAYLEVVRGTPFLSQILVLNYIVAPAFGIQNSYTVGILALAFFSGSYVSEIFRAGIESVGKSQLESARAIGLTTAQTYRFVILPQAIRQSLPPLVGQMVSLIKDSSLLFVIGIEEFTNAAQQTNAMTFRSFETFLPLAIGYLILTLPLSVATNAWERRLRYET